MFKTYHEMMATVMVNEKRHAVYPERKKLLLKTGLIGNTAGMSLLLHNNITTPATRKWHILTNF